MSAQSNDQNQPESFTTSHKLTRESVQLSDLAARLERLSQEILPSQPFLLRLHPGAQQDTRPSPDLWRKYTHFSRHEEELQYLTFRANHEGTLLYAHAQGDNSPEDFSRTGRTSRTSSGQTPLTDQPPRKKITLADYKNRDRNRPKTMNQGETPQKPGVKDGKIPKMTSDAKAQEKEKDARHNGARPVQSKDVSESSTDRSRKRALEVSGDDVAANETVDKRVAEAKKPRLTEQKDTKAVDASKAGSLKSSQKSLDTNKNSSADEQQTKAMEESGLGLPPVLSPTLPDDIESELANPDVVARLTRLNNGQNSRFSSASPLPKTQVQHIKSPSLPQSRQPNHAPGSGPSTPTTKTEKSKSVASAHVKDQTVKDATPKLHVQKQQAQPVAKGEVIKISRKESKIVTLKFKDKTNRKRVLQLLKLKPTPNKARISQNESNEAPKANANISKPDPAVKRPVSNEGGDGTERPAKRLKGGLGWLPQKTQVPKPNRAHSPSSSRPPSAQKNHLATPSNGINSSSMYRTGSQESAKTPVRQSRDASPHLNNKGESPERREWVKHCKDEAKKYVELAIVIKHDSDKYLKSENKTDEEKKLGVVIATEAALCFVLAAMISDEPGRTAKHATNTDLWNSTRTFLTSVAKNHARPFQHLYGFLQQLEGLISDTLEYHIDVRIDSVFSEYQKLKGKEPAGNFANAEAFINYHYHKIMKESHENRTKSRNAWREGEAALYHTELSKKFPKTWTKQRDYPGRGKGRDPVYLDQYAKDGFALPMGQNTTGLEAANFGLSLLEEFCEKEQVDWKPKLVL